jgi:tryptophanyl-tRNA synthetase
MKRVFSGIQPTGTIHIGNYAGAIRNWVRLQERYECIYCIVDYHAITIPYEPKELPRRVFDAALDILACGVDPERSTLMVQSHVPEHTELCWIFNTLTPMGPLERMTQFKEKSEQFRENINVGLFGYPVLQAADIVLYKAEVVPVGDDQLQHLELTREIVRKFNRTFGDTFPEPLAELTATPRIMALNDPERKMSKSLPGSFISLDDDAATIRKKIGRAVTDVGPSVGEMGPGVKNLFTLMEVFSPPDRLAHFRAAYGAGNLKYSEMKPALAEDVVQEMEPIRQRRAALTADPDRVRDVLATSARRAREIAQRTMEEVRERIGLR